MGIEARIDFVIVTALDEEREAVLRQLPGYRKLPPFADDASVYYQAEVPVIYSDGTPNQYRVIVLSLVNMGQSQAVVAASRALMKWKPRYILLVGIAGGVAGKVNVGDVLIADQIVDYELQKLVPNQRQIRWVVHPTDAQLLSAARNLESAKWRPLIGVPRPAGGAPQRQIGPVASGNKVLAEGQTLEEIRDAWSKISGVEMEAGGVALAAFQATDHPGFFMVRGVSDLADLHKGTPAVEKWRAYACEVAAAYAIGLLKSGPVVPSEPAVPPTAQAPQAFQAQELPRREIDRASLHDVLTQRFDLDELKQLCFRLGLDAENLPGESKPGKARELISYCERHGLTSDLLRTIKQLRPDIGW